MPGAPEALDLTVDFEAGVGGSEGGGGGCCCKAGLCPFNVMAGGGAEAARRISDILSLYASFSDDIDPYPSSCAFRSNLLLYLSIMRSW